MNDTEVIINKDVVDFVATRSNSQIQELEDALYLHHLKHVAQHLERLGVSTTLAIQEPSGSNVGNYIASKKLIVHPPEGASSTIPIAANLRLAERLVQAVEELGVSDGYDRWAQCLPLGDLQAGFHRYRLHQQSIEEASHRFQDGAYDAEEYRLAILAAAQFPEGNANSFDEFQWLTVDQIARTWGVSRRRAQAHIKRIHESRGIGRRWLGAWVLTPSEVATYKPADGPGRPRKLAP